MIKTTFRCLHEIRDKIEHLSSYAHVVHTTAKKVISRCGKNENVCEMYKTSKCTCKACKTVVHGQNMQICEVLGRRHYGCLVTLPNGVMNTPNRSFFLTNICVYIFWYAITY